ncbi:hypothetical protein [Streptomyces bohaiensis]|uniref:Uncharacterized protein n=1 Tax=Streptomyces bohaiensis TaxID=1431344 RepID=A0ABX1C8A2_9ACTN|nr:hypothetical protein [Streptomyces bohaiensis]NJQ14180.1 hypothetical protein [Streptomyces bohaiensis]
MQAPFHRDQVAEGGRWFHGETNSGWKTRWGFAPYYDIDVVPNVPSDEDFGARRLTNDSEDHSGYWKTEMTLKNQAAVIVGQPERASYE